MSQFLRWLALLAFVLAVIAAYRPRLGRVPWLAVGLLLWLLSVMVAAGDLGSGLVD